jgi:integrase
MKSLTKDELLRLLEIAKEDSERNHLMILMSFTHALRVSEMLTIQGRNMQEGRFTIKRLKKSLPTDHPFFTHENSLLDEKSILDRISPKIRKDEYLFPSPTPYKPSKRKVELDVNGNAPITRQRMYQIMRKYGKKAGIAWTSAHPHTLKHTFCVLFVDKLGVPKLKKRVGHKSGASTLKYLEIAEDVVNDAVAEAKL